MTLRLTIVALAVLGFGMGAGAQVAAPEFTSNRIERRHTDVRLVGHVKIRLVGTVELEADEATFQDAPGADLRLQGNVVARVLPVKP